jgi:hypothetical protein
MASSSSNITGAFCFGSRRACLAVSRPNDNPKGAPSLKPHKLSINSHRTRNLLPAVLIGDVRNSPLRQHRWLLQGLLRQQEPTRLDSCCRESKNDQQHRARAEVCPAADTPTRGRAAAAADHYAADAT